MFLLLLIDEKYIRLYIISVYKIINLCTKESVLEQALRFSIAGKP